MQQLDLEFPKSKYNFMEHIIGHDVINSWNSDQHDIEDCYRSIEETKISIEELYSKIDAIELRNKNMVMSFNDKQLIRKYGEFIERFHNAIDTLYGAIKCFLRSQDNVYRFIQTRMLEEINRSPLPDTNKKDVTGLSVIINK